MACVGRVKFFLPDKGWGRLEITGPLPAGITETESTAGIFVHFKDIVMPDDKTLASLEEGQEVSFSVTKGEKGWQAAGVKGIDGAPIKTRLHRNTLQGIFRGVVSHWSSEKAFGWIATDLSPQSLGMQRVPKSVLQLNEGRVYFRWRDCGASRESQELFIPKGKAVVFQLYWDEKGLGALQVLDAITLQPLAQQYGSQDNYKKLLDIQGLTGSAQIDELAKEMEKVTVCIVVSRTQAGSIIGQKGDTVKSLKAETGVDRIYVENGMADYRQVELRGTPHQVAEVLMMIAEHLQKEPGSQSGPTGDPMEIRMVVPDDGFGRVVGKGKAQLTTIEERCKGATISISPKVPCSQGMVQGIIVSGPSDAMTEAVKMVLVRISTCCNIMPLPRATAGGPAGPMSTMLMLQQLAAPSGYNNGKGGYGAGSYGGAPSYGGGRGYGGGSTYKGGRTGGKVGAPHSSLLPEPFRS